MTRELNTVWKQFEETYSAIRESLAAVPEDRLHWEPSSRSSTAAQLIQHIGRANLLYCNVIEGLDTDLGPREVNPGRQFLLDLLELSETRTRSTLEALTEESAHVPLQDDWNPLGPNVQGPLDAVWFAQQIVRHSAYHLGQLNYLMCLGGFDIDY
jgi:uncharacterized damage-inducible protein DinB